MRSAASATPLCLGLLLLLAPVSATGRPLAAIPDMTPPLSTRLFSASPEALSRDLRLGSESFLRQRRALVACVLAAAAIMSVVVLFQCGLIPHLPDLPGRWFDSDKVNSSATAYRFGVPDGTLVLFSLGLTLLLVAAGPADRFLTHRWLPVLLSAKTGVDALFVLIYFHDMVVRQKVACIYCVSAGLAIVAAFLWSLPEARRALSG